MDIIEGKIESPVTISRNAELRGMITQPTMVTAGATFTIRGMITADLFVEEGATAIILGMVNGCIHNAGYVELHGQADTLAERPGAKTRIVGDGYFKGDFRFREGR